ncbi:TetR family transcriptional regulator [Planctomyces sp. SH-PL62]|uniref:TetR family transcriptional regulator n=1 Tax=Planctomyces sp. SH-PL62 TaxID=1636152 RepID=UPI00078CDBD7|nr:TetR family transcriptional regulator [Planctomyces sp. SH-PL62]AMV40142.1 HTH-type transcriptional regulator AcrR [Planctomyces sp. SH-PL62]
MRKSKAEAAETRKRIVAAAAAEFRRRGIVATGLADLMKAAGLTHGGFYKHFKSKDQLIAEACAEAGRELFEKVSANAAKGSAVSSYLSTRHRDDPAAGCPLAALGPELARCDEKTREAATAGFERLVGVLAAEFGKLPPEEARRRALASAATMIGALAMARMVTDPELSAEILREAESSISHA